MLILNQQKSGSLKIKMTKENKSNIKMRHSEKHVEQIDKEEKILIKDPTIVDLEKQNKELIDTLQHLQAEFENYKKRIDRQNQDFCRFANKELILKLLPLLDNFELAFKNSENTKEFIKGVELIFSQFMDILEKEGIKKIETQDQKFDPYLHEALMQDKQEAKEEGIILEEFQKGYILDSQVIRHSKVKVNKK